VVSSPVRAVSKTIIGPAQRKTSSGGPVKPGGYMDMFTTGSPAARTIYDPTKSDDDNHDNMDAVYRAISDTFDTAVNEEEINKAARSTLKFCKKTYDPATKKISNYDHSSAAQRLRVGVYWEARRVMNNGLPKDHAERLGVSLRTMERGLISGRYVTDEYGRVNENLDWKASKRGRPSVSGTTTTPSGIATALLREAVPPSPPLLLSNIHRYDDNISEGPPERVIEPPSGITKESSSRKVLELMLREPQEPQGDHYAMFEDNCTKQPKEVYMTLPERF
jgi:hypothetical protein